MPSSAPAATTASEGDGGGHAHRRRLRRTALAATALVAVVAAACGGTATAAHTTGAPGPHTYVALGDSYSAGPAIPTQLGPGTTPSAPAACRRSSADYPALVAHALDLTLRDVSCAGATTADLTGSQGPGIPDQFSALSPSTSIVSVGIGGNDLGFTKIAAECASLTPWGVTLVGWTCQSHFTAGGTDQLAATADQVGTKVAAVLADIRTLAPHARVFVVGYPDIAPPTGTGCWPLLPFSMSDLGYLRGVEADLNAILSKEAAAAHDVYVDMAAPSASHNACTAAATRWVEPIIPSDGTYPLHPSEAGMAGMAGALEQAISSTTST